MNDEELRDLQDHFAEVIYDLARYRRAFGNHKQIFSAEDAADIHKCLSEARTKYIDRIGHFLTVGNGLSL